MSHLFLASVAILFAVNAAAEECIVGKTQSQEGTSYGSETCVGRVDDVIKTSTDGYVALNYIVQYKGQRLVVNDPLARSEHAIGDQLSFVVSKLEEAPGPRSKGFRVLNATTVPVGQHAGPER